MSQYTPFYNEVNRLRILIDKKQLLYIIKHLDMIIYGMKNEQNVQIQTIYEDFFRDFRNSFSYVDETMINELTEREKIIISREIQRIEENINRINLRNEINEMNPINEEITTLDTYKNKEGNKEGIIEMKLDDGNNENNAITEIGTGTEETNQRNERNEFFSDIYGYGL